MRSVNTLVFASGVIYHLSTTVLAEQDLNLQHTAAALLSQDGSCSAAAKQASWTEQCQYAHQHCTEAAVIPYVQWYFCRAKAFGWFGTGCFVVLCFAWLLLLFCILSSTSEEFFSPILSQISEEMGLPPRFAGVTLLALGNGAPDLSACIVAVSSGRYRLALGALLGGAMFVGCVVAGAVMMANGGVPARGALVRDMASVVITVAAIALILASGSMTWLRAMTFLALYVLYVLVVLVADLLHRHPWRPWHSRDASGDTKEMQAALLSTSEREPDDQPAFSPWGLEGGDASQHGSRPLSATLSGDDGNRSGSNSSIELQHTQVVGHLALPDSTVGSGSSGGLRRASIHAQRPTTLVNPGGVATRHGEAGHLPGHVHASRTSRVLAHYAEERGGGAQHISRRLPPIADDRVESLPAGLPWADLQPLGSSPRHGRHHDPLLGHPTPGHPNPAEFPAAQQDAGSSRGSLCGDEENQAEEPGKLQIDPRLQSVLRPMLAAWDAAGRLLSWAEAPLWVLRRATIPLLEAECYSRPWFILTMVGAPLAVLVYLRLFTLPWLAAMLLLGCALALVMGFVTREDPDVSPPLSLGTRMPIGAAMVASFGFVVAAMWIDSVASEVVAVLDLLGTASGVDHTVLGLTILAWGNSLGDLSTNVAMARRGLANMAITACYAGPMFSMLVGLGVGFSLLLAGQSSTYYPVSLSPMVLAGIAFQLATSLSILLTGLLLKSRLPARFGIVLFTLYFLYLTTSLALALAGKR